jgi:hypothetical protein
MRLLVLEKSLNSPRIAVLALDARTHGPSIMGARVEPEHGKSRDAKQQE